MDLIERYLQAVRWWLPSGEKQDILAELSEDLRSQVDEKELELGRKLDETDVEALLRRVGRPIVVAGRYLPQQHLIGPTWFPIYRLTLKLAALFYLVPWILVWIALAVFVPSFREENAGATILKSWATLWQIALFLFAAITLTFAAIERSQEGSRALADWNPRRLPRVRDTRRIPRASSIAELVFLTAFLLWWVELPAPWFDFDRYGVHPIAVSAWRDLHASFYWQAILLTLGSLGLAAIAVARPYWTRLRLGLHAMLQMTAAGILAFVLIAHRPDFLAACHALANHPPDLAQQEATGMILSVVVYCILLATGLGALGAGIVDLVRIARWKSSGRRFADAIQE